ncbi:DUF2490 domain-containing protein [Flavobacterium sp.]|uniref:DUF2490 domain-containing protein n=1 Tax=Flavobacterium sp. TaxID=239 RepID=UPI0026145198|nr:DUF2490 domain-containing protein [Flavobacterium sp.]
MKSFLRHIFLLSFLPVSSVVCYAQAEAEKTGVYLYAGVSADIPNHNKLFIYYGYSPSDNFQSLLALPFFKITKNIQFMPGYMMTKADNYPMFTNVQHHLLPSVILNFKLNEKLTLTDRNMWYHLFLKNTNDVNLYRNRLGLIYHTKILKKETDFFVYDETFWNLSKGTFFRNRLILGGSIKATKWITPQIWYAYQSQEGVQPQHQFYLFLTVPLENFGVFNKHKRQGG